MEASETRRGKLVLHLLFQNTITEINELKIRLPPKQVPEQINDASYIYPSSNAEISSSIDQNKRIKLDPLKGLSFLEKEYPISAYDESINKFACLEGSAYLTSHSLVLLGKNDYIPSCFLTIYFYTRSKALTANSEAIRYSENPEEDSKKDYVEDRTKFLVSNTPSNSILFIDGPLIGGQLSHITTKMNKELLEKDVIPLFFIKNSTSNLVTDRIKPLQGKYNSDMHWAYNTLQPGERTIFFPYRDKHNPRNAKIFCYMKPHNVSPQRIEFHADTIEKHGENLMSDLMDLCYYLMLVQGNRANPQIRPIAVAEKYARATIHLIDLNKLMKQTGLILTINQARFGWS